MRRVISAVLCLALSGTLLLSGCGGSTGAASSAASSEPQATEATAESGAEAQAAEAQAEATEAQEAVAEQAEAQAAEAQAAAEDAQAAVAEQAEAQAAEAQAVVEDAQTGATQAAAVNTETASEKEPNIVEADFQAEFVEKQDHAIVTELEATVATSKIGYALSQAIEQDGCAVSCVLTADGLEIIKTKELDELTLKKLTGINDGSMRGTVEGVGAGSFVEIGYDADGNVVLMEQMFTPNATTGAWFDSMKYGVEFCPVLGGEAGQMIACGWVLGKDGNTITVGDTNHFEEKYTAADDVKVYNLNTAQKTIAASDLESLPVTEQTDGKFSLTANRQMAVFVFDGNYTTADTAKVSEIYYLTPQVTLDEKYLVAEYDTMPIYSCFPDTETGGALEKPSTAPWIAYTEPIEFIKDKFWFVGDNDVAVFLFNTSDGLVCFDFGWPPTGYIYYQNIEELGFDPREVKNLLLSHGHGDHYGQAYDFVKMLKNCGIDPHVYEAREDAVDLGAWGYPEIQGELKDISISSIVTDYFTPEQWEGFGEDVKMYPILTPGHSVGCYSFLINVTPDEGNPVTFAYQGGLGTVHDPAKGYLRNAFAYGLQYLQQNYDIDYQIPQHMSHFPLLEINKAAKIKGIGILDALVSDNDVWVNYLDRRYEIQVLQKYHDRFAQTNEVTVNWPDGTSENFETIKVATKLKSIETDGPWKRDAGEYTVQIIDSDKAIKLMHGFNMVENVNPLLAGVTREDGYDFGNGFMITRDGYVHDPDIWFLQISMHVDDDYEGKFTDLVDATNGPVECVHGENWYEINRTMPFASKEEAEAVMATLEAGKSYKVTMDRTSYIQINEEDPMKTFEPVE